jgi:hypothetical protein
MTHDTVPPECARTDAVLAIYLDGDVGADGSITDSGFELVCGDSLRDHVLACATCRQQLLRARRLDALLAAQAGGSVGSSVGSSTLGDLASRWFAEIETIPQRLAQPPARRPRAAAVAALLLLMPFVTLIWLWVASARTPAAAAPCADSPAAGSAPVSPVPAAARDPDRDAGEVPATAPTLPPGEILIASDAAHLRARQLRPDAVQPGSLPPGPDERALPRVLSDTTQPAPVRLDAVERLAAAAHGTRAENTAAFQDLMGALASLGDRDAYQRSLHRRAIDLVRLDPHLTSQVLAQLQRMETRRGSGARDDLAVVTVAARLGDRQLDTALQRAVRRHPQLAEPLAAALRGSVRTTGGAALLLEIWQDLVARGDGDDETVPCRWFAGQPVQVFDELERTLRATRSAPRRVQCLLALGQGTGDEGLQTLLEHLQRAPFLEAHAAAFALSQRPRRQLDLLVPRARSGDMFLLRAALARAAVPAATAWIDALALDAAERALLADGAFADFPRVASWFRDRTLSSGD